MPNIIINLFKNQTHQNKEKHFILIVIMRTSRHKFPVFKTENEFAFYIKRITDKVTKFMIFKI